MKNPIIDLLVGFKFNKMASFVPVINTDKQGSIIFNCYNEVGGVEISLSDLKRLAEHINAEHLSVTRITLVDNYKGEWQIVVKYRLY